MASSFGDYITKQYGLLKQILSNLKPCDLRNAKLVCRDWSSAVESLTNKNPISLHTESSLDSYFTLPALVLYQNVPRGHKELQLRVCEKCKKIFLVCPCTVSDSDTIFLTLDSHLFNCYGGDSPTHMFWRSSSALILPSSPQIQVSTFVAESKSVILDNPVTDDVLNLCTGGPEPIKCLLIIARTMFYKYKRIWLNQLLNCIVDRQGLTFAIGGGIIRCSEFKRGFNFTKEKWKKPSIVLIALRGDNVSAHSDILSDFKEGEIDNFMQEMATRVGPMPAGATRIAFISQCVDRSDITTQSFERSAFIRAFPLATVPQYGFHAYGEFGVRGCSDDYQREDEKEDTSKRLKLDFEQSNTTSIVIITFSKI